MEHSQLQKSIVQTTSTLDFQSILDTTTSDLEKQRTQANRKSLILVYSIVVMLLSAYFCKKHSKNWRRWAATLGTTFYLFMRASNAEGAGQ